jgi:hypothetical protein
MANTVIAVCALAISVFSIYATIRHHKLSVTPHLIRSIHRDRRDGGIAISTDLCNHGIGPAKIKKLHFFLDGKPFTAEWDPVEALIESALKGKTSFVIISHSYPSKNYCIMAGQTYRLAEIFLPRVTQSDEKYINEHFKRMQFRIEYESLYGKSYILESGDLTKPPTQAG